MFIMKYMANNTLYIAQELDAFISNEIALNQIVSKVS